MQRFELALCPCASHQGRYLTSTGILMEAISLIEGGVSVIAIYRQLTDTVDPPLQLVFTQGIRALQRIELCRDSLAFRG